MSDLKQRSETAAGRVFATTQWHVVIAAGRPDSAPAQGALETLCRDYWYPIYVYVRRKGYGPSDAEDLTQEFFSQLISKEHLRLADRARGKFRSFLLATLDFFLAREWTRAHRQKRGGGICFISLGRAHPEERYQLEPMDNRTPEREFLRQWALTVLNQTMTALEKECIAEGKNLLFQEARGLLSGERDTSGYAGLAQRLGMSVGAARVAVFRLRQRYGWLLRREIAKTVHTSEAIDEELNHLMRVLSRDE